MRSGTKKEWLDIAVALHTGAHGPGDGYARHELGKLAGKVADALDLLGGHWGDNLTANLPAAWLGPNGDDCRPVIQHSHELYFLRTAWRLMTDELALIPRGERADVLSMLDRGGMPSHGWSFSHLPGPPPVKVGVDGTVGVRALLACPMGRDKAVAVWGEAVLRCVPPSRAPIVATVAGEGGNGIALRLIDGVFHRPVLSPNSWAPISLDRFVEAAASGEAWADNPWLPVPSRAVPGNAVADVVRPRSNKDRNATWHEERFLDGVGARSNRLLIVDGVVHRSCSAPTVEFGALTHFACSTVSTGMRLGWHVGNLHQFSEQGTVGGWQPHVEWRSRDDRYYTGFWPVISVSDMPLARMLANAASSTAERDGLKDEVANLCLPVPATVHDPDAMPDMAKASLERLFHWGSKQYTSSLARLGNVLATLDPANGMPDVDAVDAALDAVMAIVSEPGWKDDRNRTASSLVDALDIVAMQVRGRGAVDDMVAIPTP